MEIISDDLLFGIGFQSCVLFPSILDPSQPCLYVSEILDGGQEGPLFKVILQGISECANVITNSCSLDSLFAMSLLIHVILYTLQVSMKDRPTEVFVHPNIDNCWQMVQKRVNLAIQLHHGHCKVGLRSNEVRGYELFGFTSPQIIKASLSHTLFLTLIPPILNLCVPGYKCF